MPSIAQSPWPLGIGESWRPPQSASVQVRIRGRSPAVVATGPNSKAFYAPQVYVRYGADGVHWSDWQPLSLREDPRSPGEVLWNAQVGVPRRTSQDFYDRMSAWSRRDDIHWASDTEEFCEWLVRQEPNYFEQHQPFVGYVQFLIEDSFRGGQRLTDFAAEVHWGVGGVHALPKDPAAEKKHNGAWRFRAK